MVKIFLITICFVMTVSGLAFAAEQHVEFEGRYWITDIDANARVEDSNIGKDFDLKADLGIDDENFPEGRVTWHTGPNSRIRFCYTQIGYEGSQDVARSIEFNGQTYTAGTLVETELDVKYLRLGWIWEMIRLMNDKIKVGAILEAKGVLADVSLDAPRLSPALSESKEFAGGIPSVGLTLSVSPIEKVKLFAEASGVSVGDYGHFLDAEAGLQINPCKNFSIVGGYRVIDIEAENEPDFINMEISGPFVAATLKF